MNKPSSIEEKLQAICDANNDNESRPADENIIVGNTEYSSPDDNESNRQSEQSETTESKCVEELDVASVGAKLREARQQQNLTEKEVAASLHLNAKYVKAMEENDWSVLPCQTSALGFVRNYTRLLGLDTETLLEQVNREIGAFVSVASNPVGETKYEKSSLPWGWWTVILGLLVVAALFLYYQDESDIFGFVSPHSNNSRPLSGADNQYTPADNGKPDDEKTAPLRPSGSVSLEGKATTSLPGAKEPNLLSEPGGGEQMVSEPVAGIPDAKVADGGPVKDHTQNEVKPIGEAAPDENDAPIYLEFQGESWVEISDRNGNVLLYELQKTGTRRYISGEAPFSVVIGNSPQVKLRYRGKLIDLKKKRSANAVARLTLP